ncbi:DUF3014 domain-containing protein [Algiphilus sp.]|uniref:DUF3014 domain-containing protein n=1 Tax=Algiphilus sp. TaxID=1872431 RepID=UPI003BA95FF3
MNRSVVVALLLIVIAAGGGYWWWSQSQDTTVDDGPETAVNYRDPTPAEPTAREPEPPEYPVSDLSSDGVDAEVAQGEASSGEEAAEAGPAPLPPLAESDEAVRADLRALTGDMPIEGRLVPRRLVQRFVVWVNSLDGQIVPVTKWPVQHVPGRPLVETRGDNRFEWLPANAERYQPYVRAFTAPDTDTMVDVYLRYYPLLQQAFAALGEEEDYFNDRLIAIIDHLLAAPPARERYLLVQPEVLYAFADPDLEALSSGQKILLRLGPEASKAVRAKLRDFRTALVARTTGDRAAGSNG